ncbi:MAG: cryptochrome/photolyase family protein [Ornithinimicrobium sp.]
MTDPAHVRLVFPHQLFAEHLQAADGTTFVLIEDDLFFRQYAFHSQKLILHRASMRRFASRLREAGYAVRAVETEAERSSGERWQELVTDLDPERVTLFDPVDDWLWQRTHSILDHLQRRAGSRLRFTSHEDVLESPNFLTTRQELREWFAENSARMQHFYSWQRQRLDVLVDHGRPVGGQWSFDSDNRKKLPKGHPVPAVSSPERVQEVTDAIAWVKQDFPEAPGAPDAFAWPTCHDEAESAYGQFLQERFAQFGPYEDAVSSKHPFCFHSVLTAGLNIGLIDPRTVLERALSAAEGQDIPLASLEGFVRQVIGWREYMRATYVLWGSRMRTSNALQHSRSLDAGWWTGDVGLAPVDHVLTSVDQTAYAHHIERLMILGNLMCLLRTDPTAVYEWFMEMFIDAYDWVMVPNVYGMSQFAAGEAITTKPYVSGSNYLRKMSDFAAGDWAADWDGLYWAFVADQREVFEANHRSRMMTRMWDGMDGDKQAEHRRNAQRWLG